MKTNTFQQCNNLNTFFLQSTMNQIILNVKLFQTPSKVFSNAKPYEAPKQTPALTPPAFTSGFNQVHTGMLLS